MEWEDKYHDYNKYPHQFSNYPLQYKWFDQRFVPNRNTIILTRLRSMSEDPAIGDSIYNQAIRNGYDLERLMKLVNISKPKIIIGGGLNDPYMVLPKTEWRERPHSFAPMNLIMLPSSKYSDEKELENFLAENAHLVSYQEGLQNMGNIVPQIAAINNLSNYEIPGMEENKTHMLRKNHEEFNYEQTLRDYISNKIDWKKSKELRKQINEYGDSVLALPSAQKMASDNSRLNPSYWFSKKKTPYERNLEVKSVYDEYAKRKRDKYMKEQKTKWELKKEHDKFLKVIGKKQKASNKIPYIIEYEKPQPYWSKETPAIINTSWIKPIGQPKLLPKKSGIYIDWNNRKPEGK